MLNTKSCLVLATEGRMISSSYVWGTTEYRVQLCMALVCTGSLFWDCV